MLSPQPGQFSEWDPAMGTVRNRWSRASDRRSQTYDCCDAAGAIAATTDPVVGSVLVSSAPPSPPGTHLEGVLGLLGSQAPL